MTGFAISTAQVSSTSGYVQYQADVGDWAIYDNAATLPDGTTVQVRITITSNPDGVPVTLDSPDDGTRPIHLNDGPNANSIYNGSDVGFEIEFLDQATGLPLSIDGHLTFVDLDGTTGSPEGIGLDLTDLSQVEVSATSDVTSTVVGTQYTGVAPEVPTGSDDQDNWVTARFVGQESVSFSLVSRFSQSGYGISANELSTPVIVPGTEADNIVNGTAGNDLIGAGFEDADGTDIDGSDATGTHGEIVGSDADSIQAGDGNDTVFAGADNDTVSGGIGADSLDGGIGNDSLSGDAGADTILGGAGADTILAGSEDDVVAGGAGADEIFGEAGNDQLGGGGGNDTLFGNDGADYLSGGAGEDSLSGGIDSDTLQGGTGNDTLSGGGGGDVIYGDTDPTLNGGADPLTSAYYNTGNGELYTYDAATGTGTLLQSGLQAYGDIAVTSDGTLYGITFLAGSEGIYEIDPVTGTETLVQSLPGDTYATLTAGPGDTLYYSSNTTGELFQLTSDGAGGFTTASVGTLPVPSYDIVFTDADTALVLSNGNVFQYDVSPTGVFSNQTDLGSVNGQTDVYGLFIDGNGVVYAIEGTGEALSTDPNTLPLTWTPETGVVLNGGDVFGAASVYDTGTYDPGSGADSITAGGGNDTVFGGAGDDTVFGNDGADVIEGGLGNDSLDGDAGSDSISGGEGADTIIGDGGNDTLSGGDGNDEIYDTNVEAGAEVIDAGAGSDTVFSGAGNDSIIGGTGADSINAGADADTIVADGGDTVDGGDGGVDNDTLVLTNVASIDISGPDGNGNGYDGVVTFNDASTMSFSEIENFIVDGSVWTPDNIVSGTSGDDVIDGTYTGDPHGEQVDAGDAQGTHGETAGSNADSIEAGAGNDTVNAGADADTVDGGTGNDVLFGNGGDDSIIGGAGDDRIQGDIGNDTLLGGADADRFEQWRGEGNDTVIGGETGNDSDVFWTIDTTDGVNVTFTGTEAGTSTHTDGTSTTFTEIEQIWGSTLSDVIDASASMGDQTLSGEAGDDTITGGAGNDSLRGGDNNDSVSGGTGNDSISGGDGNDVLRGEDGNDTILGDGGSDTIYNGSGDDSVIAGSGNDIVYTEGGNDTVDGGLGSDDIYVTEGTGSTVLVGGEDAGNSEKDCVILDATGAQGGTIILTGEESGTFTFDSGNGDGTFTEMEVAVGSQNDDVIDASATTDGFEVMGRGGDDSIIMGSGNDYVLAGTGADTIEGGAGNDVIDLGNNGAGATDGDADVVILSDGSGQDSISWVDIPTDNGDGTFTGIDTLDVSGLTSDGGTTPVHVGDVVVSDDGNGNAVLTFPGGESLLMYGVDPTFVNNPAVLEAFGIPPVPGGDNIVQGTAGDDIIGQGYTDPDNTSVDANDALGTHGEVIGSNADSIEAGDGNDSVLAGQDNDTVIAGSGNDTVQGQAGDDSLSGGIGDDVLHGGSTTGGVELIQGGSFEGVTPTTFGQAGDHPNWYSWNNGSPDLNEDGGFEVAYGAPFTATDGSNFVSLVQGSNGFNEGVSQDLATPLVAGTTYTLTVNAAAGWYQGSSVFDPAGGSAELELYGNPVAGQVDAGSNEAPAGSELLGTATVTTSINSGGFEQVTITFTPTTDIQTITLSVLDEDVTGFGAFATLAIDEVSLMEAAVSDNDTLNGGDGNDTLFGGDGNDVLLAGTDAGNDSLDGGAGNDTLNGEDGEDTLNGGTGDDRIFAGTGDDTVILEDNFGSDTISGGSAGETNGDALDMTAVTTNTTVDLSDANPENGTVSDGSGTTTFTDIEKIFLGGGRDTLILADGSGNDTVNAFDMTDSGDGTTMDQLDVSGLTSDGGVTPVTTDDVVVTDTNGDGTGSAILTFPGGESITLIGVSPSQVDTQAELISIGIPGPLDFIVEGTGGDDLIDAAYVGDPEGDLIDNLDHSDGSNNDSVFAGAGNDTVFAGAGNDTVDGGTGNDELSGEAGNDTLIGGEGLDTLFGGDGNDSLAGGDDNDRLEGQIGDDTLNAGRGADYLDGGAGADSLIGGDGDDTLVGGATAENDTLAGGAGADSAHGGGGDDSIIGGIGNDTLHGDSGNDTVLGGDGLDSLYGGDGNDSLSGGADADRIEAWLGDDTLDGGTGDDYLDGASGNDSLIGGDGNDTLLGGSAAGADTLIGGAGNDSLSSGDDDDILFGGTGDDTIFAGSGDDIIVVEDNFGNDQIDGWSTGETFGDMLDGTGLTQDVTLDLSAGDPNDPESGTLSNGTDTLTFVEIENVLLGSGNDSVIGSDGNDQITVGDGSDTIDAGAGNDTINLAVPEGPTFDGNIDTLVMSDGDGDDSVFGFEVPVDNGDGTFTGLDQLDVADLTDFGGAPVNTGDVVVSDTNGDGTGDAILLFPNGESITLQGADPIYINNPLVLQAMGIPAPDYIVEGTSGADLIDGSYVGDPEGDVVDGADNQTGTNSDLITAGGGNDTVYGGVENDTILGEDGDDTLVGNDGADSLSGGLGNDLLVGGNAGGSLPGSGDGFATGNDTLDGGAGNDTLEGGNGADSLIGGTGADSLNGGSQNDTLLGGDQNDTLVGGDGEDSLVGGTGDDQIIGGAGADTIEGGTGNDTLVVGSGDLASGGDGDDVFNLTPANLDGGDLTIVGGEGGETLGDTLNVTGPATIVYNSPDQESGTITYINTGEVVTFSEIENLNYIPCFTPGTLIKTDKGEIPVEEIKVGTRVLTRDNGYQKVIWAGARHIDAQTLAQAEALNPILIRQGSLGKGLPERDMMVSPQHRVLIEGADLELFFGQNEVLVPAKFLSMLPGFEQVSVDEVTYIHFMFEQHEVVMSDGCWTESFQPGDMSIGALGDAAREEVYQLFPALRQSSNPAAVYPAARSTLTQSETRVLMH